MAATTSARVDGVASIDRDDQTDIAKVLGILAVVLVGAVGFLLLWPVLLVAVLLSFLGKKLGFTKTHWGVLLGAAVLAYLLTFMDSMSYYLTWILSIYGDFGKSIATSLFDPLPKVTAVPYPVITMSATVTACIGLVQGTFIETGLRKLFGKKKPEFNFRTSIVPQGHEKKALVKQIRAKTPPLKNVPGCELSKLPQPERGKGVGPIAFDRNKKIINLSSEELKTHMVILGSTGSGKTVLLKALIGMLLDFGYDGTMVDLKEDTAPGELRDFCRAYAWRNDLNYQEIALSDPGGSPWWFNPLDGMRPDEALNAIMATQSFDDQYHQNQGRKMANAAIQLCYEVHDIAPERFPPPSMFDIGSLMENLGQAKALINLVKAQRQPALTDVEIKERFGPLEAPDKDLKMEAMSFGTKLTNIYNSEAGRNVLRPGKTPWGDMRKQLNLSATGMTYIGISSTSQRDTAEKLSAAILQRFSVMAAKRSAGVEERTERFLMIDEASIINRDITINLLNKCRSANIRVILATQGPDDWNTGTEKDWDRISQNHNVSIFMRMPSVSAVELTSQFIGEGEFTQLSHSLNDDKLTGNTTATSVSKAIVDPEELRQLGPGEFVMRVGAPYNLTWGHGYMRDSLEIGAYTDAGRPSPRAVGDEKWVVDSNS